jgi:dihydroorotate dehydrogenase
LDLACEPVLIYRLVFNLVLVKIDAERAHGLAVRFLKTVTRFPALDTVLRRLLHPIDPRLQIDALGLKFPSPMGVAAGMDKEVTCFEALGTLGFGFVEVGTITALKQPGTPGRRVWRMSKDRALINAMGFPNPGAVTARARLHARSGRTIVGINIGKSQAVPVERAEHDYCDSIQLLASSADYIVLNVSSPNTRDLRDLQAVNLLRDLIEAVRAELGRLDLATPILVKIAPDLTEAEVDAIADLALDVRLDGIVAVNTTVDRAGLSSAEPIDTRGRGGVSGAPLKERAVQVLQRLYARVGNQVVLISVGGIETADDAWQRILAGATLLQSHTGFVYGGPLWPRDINRGLSQHLDRVQAPSLQGMIGAAVRNSPHDNSAVTVDDAFITVEPAVCVAHNTSVA